MSRRRVASNGLTTGATWSQVTTALSFLLVASFSSGLGPPEDQCDAAWALADRGGVAVLESGDPPLDHPDGRRLSAGLAEIDLDGVAGFALFGGAPRSDGSAAGEAEIPRTVGRFSLYAEIEAGSTLSAALLYSADGDRVPEGLRLTFKPRTFSDLDPWEQAGYVLRQASAVAGAAYLLYRLLE